LAEAYVHGSGSLVAPFHLELDVLSFLQTLEVEALEAAAMEENLLAVAGANESESAIADDPLDCPLHGYLDPSEDYLLLGLKTSSRMAAI
jgi:hypothetical protein